MLKDAVEEQAPDQAQQFATRDGQPYADDYLNLAEDKIAELRSICNAMDQRDQWARMIELIRCTLRRYFFIGIQHPYWNADAGQFQVGPSGDAPFTGDTGDLNEEELFEEEFNIFTSYAKVFIAVFSQNAAPSRMEPDRPKDGDSVKAAREADKYVEVYQKYNPPKCAQMEVGRLMWTDGRILAITDYETDEEKCGTDENGDPQGTEMTKYVGVLESKVPIIEEFKKWPYCKVSRELDITVAKDDNPDAGLPDKIEASSKGVTPNNEIARMSRIAVGEGIAQVSSDTLAYLVTEDTWWLRPSAFRHLEKAKQAFWIGGTETDDEGNKTKITGLFEKGCRLKFIGTVFCGAKAVSMDQQVRVMHTMPGNGNARPSISDAMVPLQMEFNDAMGMYSEMIHKCIPHTLINSTPESLQAIDEQFSRYGQWAAMQISTGGSLAENIFQETQIDVPQSFPLWLQNLQGPLAQQIANIQPAMFGGNMEDQKTAQAYQQAKDMSLGVMAIVWVPYIEFASGIRWQAARLAGQRDQEKISAVLPQKDGKTKTIDIDVALLGRGGFTYGIATDQNFPESHGDMEKKWLGLFGAAPTNPIALAVFQEPDNLVALKDATGLDITIKGAAARDKQLAEWEMMQAEDGPIPDLEATQQKAAQKQNAAQQAVDQISPGQQAPPVPEEPMVETSSVPIRLADDHIEEARTCVRILNDSKTLEMLKDRPEVVHDLELHLIAHLTKAQTSGIAIPPDLLGIIPAPAPMPAVPGTLPGTGPAAGAAALPAGPKPPIAKPAAAAPPIQ